MSQNYKPEVLVNGEWGQNALVFEEESAAIASARDLYLRWTLCTDYRAVATDLPANK